MNNKPQVVVIKDKDGNVTVKQLPARPPYMTAPEESE